MLERNRENPYAIQMILQSFSLVPVSVAQGKLSELLPYMSRVQSDSQGLSG